MLQRRIVEVDHGEGLWRWHERDARTGFAVRVSHDLKRPCGHTIGEADDMLLAVAPDGELKHARQCIHHRHANAMQSARHFV